jgi:hypothetical protein
MITPVKDKIVRELISIVDGVSVINGINKENPNIIPLT